MYRKIIGHIRLIEKFLSIININYRLFYVCFVVTNVQNLKNHISTRVKQY